MMQLHLSKDLEINEGLMRHMVLNSLRSYRTKFFNEFGELVIACDDTNYWRKDIFPYYKANRKKNRDESTLDWNKIFTILNKIRDELKVYFPYKVIQIPRLEADDIIASICHKYGKLLNVDGAEKILIISGDKDFNQLQKYVNVSQYDPVRSKWIKTDDPEKYLIEHIIRGDGGDGVPNFLSPDDSIVLNIRQKPIYQKKVDVWVKQDPSEFCDTEQLKSNWKRNDAMVNLFKIPSGYQDQVLTEFDAQINKHENRKHLFDYFFINSLKNLMGSLNDF